MQCVSSLESVLRHANVGLGVSVVVYGGFVDDVAF